MLEFFKRLFGRRADNRPEEVDSNPEEEGGKELEVPLMWVASVDPETRLECLELDGKLLTQKEARELHPLHSDCECLTIPYPWALEEYRPRTEEERENLEGRKASPFGAIPRSGGIWSAFLIERGRGIRDGVNGRKLADHLMSLIPGLLERFPREQYLKDDLEGQAEAEAQFGEFQDHINNLYRIIWESANIALTSKDPDTARSRYELALKTLREYLAYKPYRKNVYHTKLRIQKMECLYPTVSCLNAAEGYIQKQSKLKTAKGRLKHLEAARLALQEGLTREGVESETINEKLEYVERLIQSLAQK